MPADERSSKKTHDVSAMKVLNGQDMTSNPQVKQTHVWLTDDDVALLDAWSYRLRRGGWQRATRSACVRALITVLHDIEVDISGVADEEALVEALQIALAKQHE
jgi:hypothetical protein